jgi:hypothetical protein
MPGPRRVAQRPGEGSRVHVQDRLFRILRTSRTLRYFLSQYFRYQCIAYHANVLEALDDEQCPLHNALGTLDVRSQLGLAKDFRNAWKDAGKEVSDKYDQRDSVKNVKLPNLGLETMIITLINGCANANVVVQAYEGVDVSGSGLSSRDFKPPSHTNNSVVVNNTPFEFMDDMMDLD